MKILVVGVKKEYVSSFLAWFRFNGIFFHCNPLDDQILSTVFIYPKDKKQLKNCNEYIKHCRKYDLM